MEKKHQFWIVYKQKTFDDTSWLLTEIRKQAQKYQPNKLGDEKTQKDANNWM